MTAPAALAEQVRRVRDFLLAEYPELADDPDLLADMLDGETNAADMVAALVRQAEEDMAMARAVGEIARANEVRKARFERRSEMRRRAAHRLMELADIRKVERPDLTVSIKATPPKVEVYEPDALPDACRRMKWEPNVSAIKERLTAGMITPGARLTNGGTTIQVRTR